MSDDAEINIEHLCFYCGGNHYLQVVHFPLKRSIQYSRVLMPEPCDSCKSIFSTGMPVFETNDKPLEGSQQVLPNLWLTGRWALIEPIHAFQLFEKPRAEHALKQGKAFVTAEAYKRFGWTKPDLIH